MCGILGFLGPQGSVPAQPFSAALFEDAVRLRHRNDVPVGITLSGGIDSIAVLAASVRTSGNHPVCFTSVYAEHGEGEAAWARKAAAPYGIQPIEVPNHLYRPLSTELWLRECVTGQAPVAW
jgi:asparagine synthase (glutamine-hydrolysing)